ncbi:hypothetical protein SBFV1_gp51 [Sulfolobales Beppu filamentous phage 1]|uniref:Uncharacterized protein n=1 Tax=Sulfolobales Beppu filamentous phage 1 TaxID=2493122 RepID=A0A3S8NEU6_9VIRU|nr:hypothetical protein SBFV1_gp51 [Sulfolobales Beppu filamentous phage 1]
MSNPLIDIEKLFTGIFRPVTNVLSGGINTVASIPHDIENFGNSVVKTFNTLVRYLAQIPSDIFNFLSQIPGAILTGLHMFGSWILSGFQTLGSHILGALKIAFSPLVDAIHYIASHIPDLINFFASIYTDLRNIINTIHNNLVNIFTTAFRLVQDAIEIVFGFLNVAPQIFRAFSIFVQDAINFVTTQATTLVSSASQMYKHFTDSVPFDILKQESSKFGKATARLIGFNTAMEIMKSTIRRSWLSQNISPLTRALMLAFSPVVAGISGMFAETMIQAFYPDITSTTIKRYTPPTTSTTLFPYHTTHVEPPSFASKSYITTLSQLTPPSAPPLLPQFKPGHIISIYIEDVITLNQFVVTGGLVSASQYAQIISDTLNLQYNLVVRLTPVVLISATDLVSPLLSSSITTAVSQNVNTITVNAFAEVGQLAVPLGSSVCTTLIAPASYVYGENTVDYLNVAYNLCININQAILDFINFYITTQPPPGNVPTTTVNIFITTQPPPGNVPTTVVNITGTTILPPPNIPTTIFSITITPGLPQFTGHTTLAFTTQNVTTRIGGTATTIVINYTPTITICLQGDGCYSA